MSRTGSLSTKTALEAMGFGKTVLEVWANHARLTRNMPPRIQDIFPKLTPFYTDDTFCCLPDKEIALAAYRRNNRLVRELVPAEQLFVFTPSDGWAPLCAFPCVPVPDQPFPCSKCRDAFPDDFEEEPVG